MTSSLFNLFSKFLRQFFFYYYIRETKKIVILIRRYWAYCNKNGDIPYPSIRWRKIFFIRKQNWAKNCDSEFFFETDLQEELYTHFVLFYSADENIVILLCFSVRRALYFTDLNGCSNKLYKLACWGLPEGFLFNTRPTCKRGCYSFPWIAPLTLDAFFIMLIIK